jgi:hypothetical protein
LILITIDTLLSGIIGAILAIMYQRYRDGEEKKYLLAKERLGKIYGPLLLIFDAYKDLAISGNERFLYCEAEEKNINDMLFQSYHLIEETRKAVLLNLYRHRKFSEYTKDKDVIDAIKNGYNENLAIITQKNIVLKVKDYLKKKRGL